MPLFLSKSGGTSVTVKATNPVPCTTAAYLNIGHVLRWVQHLYPMTERQNKRSDRNTTNLPTRKVQ
ncbi:hypothetical protein E2C01_041498 [Portunus trituberculatus]|uniref:Uncharacterized protein n=1 Tax=Portunus trituberculatus TaxID=210409 RepID=A0A5B7FMS3_PORTR|nr:hypothetical protein [Portunus trituberculatus]